ncbi:hypothetical protein [Amycolatopsis viridis]|uniref:Secreted protein n=1 Tax=Amycolatopsis viridis TaxID=185678 RepID=A0ABX0T4W0_9PSEU|nr:hypothetical protein [Amycolatopsis viridis]NIH82934.1 hypothetical protein [Amycolatopsis viridis]
MRGAVGARRSAWPLPTELKLLLTGGFVFAGWLLFAVLGTPPAAADEGPSEPDSVATGQQPGFLGTVTGILGTLDHTVSRVNDAVGTTLSAVTGTVDTTVPRVTEKADRTTNPISDIVVRTVETVIPTAPQPVEHGQTEAAVHTGTEPVTTAPAPEPIVTEPSVAEPAPPTALSAPVAPAAAPAQSGVHRRPVTVTHEPAPPKHPQDIVDPAHADTTPHAPAPAGPGDPGVAISVSHDSGNGGRDLVAVLGQHAAAVPVQPIEGALTSAFVGTATAAGLPPTSPD